MDELFRIPMTDGGDDHDNAIHELAQALTDAKRQGDEERACKLRQSLQNAQRKQQVRKEGN